MNYTEINSDGVRDGVIAAKINTIDTEVLQAAVSADKQEWLAKLADVTAADAKSTPEDVVAAEAKAEELREDRDANTASVVELETEREDLRSKLSSPASVVPQLKQAKIDALKAFITQVEREHREHSVLIELDPDNGDQVLASKIAMLDNEAAQVAALAAMAALV